MRAKSEIPAVLKELLLAQEGAISIDQCRLAGLPRTRVAAMVADGNWQRVGSGLYLASSGAPSLTARQWLAVLAGGDGAALTAESSAHAGGWGPAPNSIQVLLAPGRRHCPAGPWEAMRTRVPFRTVGLLPRTKPERAALDMIARHPQRTAAILTDAIGSRVTTPRRLLDELAAFPSFPRRRFIREMLGDIGEGALSVLELKWLREVERAHGLPRGQRQTGSRVGLRDIRYGKLLVELDGRLGHEGSGAFRDMQRDNLHVLQGETTMRFGFHDVDQRPCAAAAMVVAVLRQLGEVVDPHSCVLGCREDEALLDWVT